MFALSVALRCLLALANREANDQHLDVARIIADQGWIPGLSDVPQGVQPKLYHASVASLWVVLGVASSEARQVTAQLVSCAFGIGTVGLLWVFLRPLRISSRARSVTFALVALNPSLVGIGAQATNDSLVIFSVSLGVLGAQRLFARPAIASWLLLTSGSALAALAKGNGLVLLPAVLAAFVVQLANLERGGAGTPRRRALLAASAWCGATVVVVLALFPARDHYRLFSAPFVTRSEEGGGIRSAAAAFTARPGIRSVADGLLTFRLADLVLHPVIQNGPEPVPSSRTSLWSMLYGRYHFSRFPSWPPSWQARDSLAPTVGRVAFLLGLAPTALLAAAVLQRAGWWLRRLGGGWRADPPSPLETLIDALVLGYLAFIVVFALAYRDFSFMKDIFVLPAVLGFAARFARGLSVLEGRHRRIARLVTASAVLLLVVYVVDIVTLVRQLGEP